MSEIEYSDLDDIDEATDDLNDTGDLDDVSDVVDTPDIPDLADVTDAGDVDDTPDVDEREARLRDALQIPIENRSPYDWEAVDEAYHYAEGYEPQRAFIVNDAGEIVDAERNARGSQRPDLCRVDESGNYHIVETKAYTNVDALVHNMRSQTADRRALFGDDVDICFDIAADKLTVGDAERITKVANDDLGVNVDYLKH